jgi:phosphoribosyl 1,2-cyclic phosphodiesterase
VLITHEHSDHVGGLPVLARRIPVPVYLSQLTAPTIDWGERGPAAIETFQAGTSFNVGDIAVASFSIPHDAIDPVGFSFRAAGIKISMATDLGYVPDSVKYHLRGSDVLLFEANHDLDMLKVGPYPWSVKQRVMSRVGHLSNLAMSEYLMEEFETCTRHLILGHLSEQNNHPEIVRMVARQTLEERGVSVDLAIASQREPAPVLQF